MSVSPREAPTRFFTIRLAGPCASFGGVQLDGSPSVLPIPTRSMITGLLGAALGWTRRQHHELQGLQDELELGFVVHRPGVVIWDFQTTDLAKPHMAGPTWTLDVDGRLGAFDRLGGAQDRAVARRPITCDVDITSVIGVQRDPVPLLAALDRPVFPLWLGRCGMATTEPMAGEILDVPALDAGVSHVASARAGLRWLPVSGATLGVLRTVPAGRDWKSRRHGGADSYVIL